MAKYKKITAYMVFGILTTVVNVAVYYICYQILKIPNIYSTAAAWCMAVVFAFLTNKPFVFESRNWSQKTVAAEAVRFFGCRALTGVLELALMFLLVDILALQGTVMKIFTNIIVIMLNYIAGKYFVFDS